ncbi:Glycosyl transferase family 14 protein [Dioscorea alata]|nr:Glycosyl transferase family 14 protein [Dioscorea alata]
MQARVLTIEEGKDLSQRTQPRVFPMRVLKVLGFLATLGICFFIASMYMTQYYGIPNVVSQARSSFQVCWEEPRDLQWWIKPPSKLLHNMTDEELFWRASMEPQVEKYPFKRVRKVAFMFLTIGPLPLSPLWEKYFKGHERRYSIYIHSLPNYKADFPESSVFYRRQIPSQVSEWGKMSMCDAERRLLANALLDISNEWFVLLSEACIPLYPFSITYRYLMRSRFSYVGAFDDPSPHGRGRYDPNMAPEVDISLWRKASQWFEVNRELAVIIIKDTKFYPKFKEFCKPDCYVDEHYFPTMLTIETPHKIANRTITWVDWSRGGAHPATFGKADITESFLKTIIEGQTCLFNGQKSNLCYMFARKFAPSALEPLLQLAPDLLGYG